MTNRQEQTLRQRLIRRSDQLKTDIPAVFIALSHPRTPFFAKCSAALTLIYALSPIDLIPDFIPVLGLLDDLLILPLLIALTVRLIPDGLFSECRARADGHRQKNRPKAWIFALPILLFWLWLASLIWRAFRGFA